ncbi:DUF1349 domain-containing protein [Alienimonas californiensis]|uniref:Beta-xylosidase C-terminal Concanavalin A-like domain-containing protein n=1 Tax=Alienimonas californiensis TaxID=2527989 RepID=A0A517P693_9PLAN|nr:DUF1349 domain-containing protein [Alienimonas californiensis]QDT14882.1 hypothetical protein CA12_09620 [Alienimonas californiensis]
MTTVAAALCLAVPLLAVQIADGAGDSREVPGWGVAINPGGDGRFAPDGSRLTLSAPGPVHGLSAELNQMNAPRVLQPAEGDFDVEVKVEGGFAPGRATLRVRKAYHGAGLLLMKDDRTYIRLERASFRADGQTRHYANFELRLDGQLQRIGLATDMPLDPTQPTWLRLERRGDVVTARVRQQQGAWKTLGDKSAPLPLVVQVGVCAVNASTVPFRPTFSELKVVAAGDSAAPGT